jgi:hypothetical protein
VPFLARRWQVFACTAEGPAFSMVFFNVLPRGYGRSRRSRAAGQSRFAFKRLIWSSQKLNIFYSKLFWKNMDLTDSHSITACLPLSRVVGICPATRGRGVRSIGGRVEPQLNTYYAKVGTALRTTHICFPPFVPSKN